MNFSLLLHLSMKPTKPPCFHCGMACYLTTGRVVYPHRPDLFKRSFWKCKHCPDSFVGCHREGVQVKNEGLFLGVSDGTWPLGMAANAELRRARSAAHRAFDPFWKEKGYNRSTAYAILAVRTGIPPRRCHISMMGIKECQRVVEVCKSWC